MSTVGKEKGTQLQVLTTIQSSWIKAALENGDSLTTGSYIN
jgi:hypothetical protein